MPVNPIDRVDGENTSVVFTTSSTKLEIVGSCLPLGQARVISECHNRGGVGTDAHPSSTDRWERHDWWGVVLDAPEVAVLARFYSELRGWTIHHLDEDDASLDAGEGVAYLNIQRNAGYVRPKWPAEPGQQQMMAHLDFEVTDLEAETKRAVSLGATLPVHQPQEKVRVLLDPAGHPFCLYTE